MKKESGQSAFSSFILHPSALILSYLRQYIRRKHVRPWALAAPVLVVLVCLPLLKPIRQPDPRRMGDEEAALFATIQSLVEHRTLAIDQSSFLSTRQKIRIGRQDYSQTPPMMPLILSAPYYLLHRFGLNFAGNPTLVMYLLTLIGVTLPVAAASGLVYRMARLFELARPWRALLAFIVAFGSGWISYATVLNPYAPSAALVLSGTACLIHVALLNRRHRTAGWLMLTGFCISLAFTIDCGAGIFLFLLAAVIPAMRWSWPLRVTGLLMYVVGATIPIVVHVAVTKPVFGDWRVTLFAPPKAQHEFLPDLEADEMSAPTFLSRLGDDVDQFFGAILGRHGLLTHFPVLVLGFIGVGMVMHRHWPTHTKMLAGSSIAGILGVIGLYMWIGADWHGGMFAARSLLVCLPVAVFWSGVWLRRPHTPPAWSIAGTLLGISCLITLLGAANPCPREGYDRYTALGAARLLRTGEAPVDLDGAPSAHGG